jgi:cytochrome c5
MTARAWCGAGAVLLAMTAGAGCASVAQSEPRHVAAPAHVQGGDWFVQSGCTSCHSMSVYGIRNFAATAPDLSVAVEDVPRRFGRTLDDFLQAPTGTMAMVLSGRITLTSEDRALAIEKLKEAYRKHQESAGSDRPVASH